MRRRSTRPCRPARPGPRCAGLAGGPFDLTALRCAGVGSVGRLAAIRDGRALFSGSLRNKCELADLKLGRLLDTIDEWALLSGIDGSLPEPHRFKSTVVPQPP